MTSTFGIRFIGNGTGILGAFVLGKFTFPLGLSLASSGGR
jgi:hypothetical protein